MAVTVREPTCVTTTSCCNNVFVEQCLDLLIMIPHDYTQESVQPFSKLHWGFVTPIDFFPLGRKQAFLLLQPSLRAYSNTPLRTSMWILILIAILSSCTLEWKRTGKLNMKSSPKCYGWVLSLCHTGLHIPCYPSSCYSELFVPNSDCLACHTGLVV